MRNYEHNDVVAKCFNNLLVLRFAYTAVTAGEEK